MPEFESDVFMAENGLKSYSIRYLGGVTVTVVDAETGVRGSAKSTSSEAEARNKAMEDLAEANKNEAQRVADEDANAEIAAANEQKPTEPQVTVAPGPADANQAEDDPGPAAKPQAAPKRR